MNDERGLGRAESSPLAEIGRSSRLLDRGVARLTADRLTVPRSAVWEPVVIWDPAWNDLAPAVEADISPITGTQQRQRTHSTSGTGWSIDDQRLVRGDIHSSTYTPFSSKAYWFEWDIERKSGTVSTENPTRLFSPSDPTVRVLSSNDDGVFVGYIQDAIHEDIRDERNQQIYPSSACVIVDGDISRLPSLGGLTSEARAVNRAGDIVGFSSTPEGIPKAVLWRGTDIVSLPNPFSISCAWGINAAGQIIGRGSNSSDFGLAAIAALEELPNSETCHGLVWDGDGAPCILSMAPDAINGAGQVIGNEYPSDEDYAPGRGGLRYPLWWQRATVWSKGETTRLRVPEPYSDSYATDLNERGDVVGGVSYHDRSLYDDSESTREEFWGSDSLPLFVPCVWLRSTSN